jgi:predicted MFS family arabinose efflux permease
VTDAPGPGASGTAPANCPHPSGPGQSQACGDPATGPGPPTRGPRSPWRHPAIGRVLISNTISGLGSGMTALALPWFVLITTGSVTRMGLVYAAEVLPIAVLGIPSGLLVARLGVRRTLVTGDGLLAVLIALVPLLHLMGLLPFWLLLLIVGATGAVTAPYASAQRLLLPEVLGDDESLVTAGNALVDGSSWVTISAGPALAGIMIAAFGALNVIWIDAATYLFSAVFLLGLPRPSSLPVAGAHRSRRVLAGARYAISDGLVRRIMTAAACYGVLVPLLLISLPILAKIRYGGDPHVAGWLLAAFGGGSLAGTLAVPPLARRFTPLKLGATAALALAVPLWFLPLHQPTLTIALIIAIAGFCGPFLNSPIIAILSIRPPEHLRAQVMTLLITTSSLARPLSYALAGLLITNFGIAYVQLAMALGYTACAGLILSVTRFKN